MKFEQKVNAIYLRRKGKSYDEISQELGVPKSTLSNWLKNIKLTSRQKKDLMDKKLLAAYKGAKANQEYAKRRRKVVIKRAREDASELITNPLFLAGLMLYWAEGNKTTEKVVISNSDPEIIRLMMRWFREICHVSDDKFRISLYLHKFHVREDARDFWSKITTIPLSQFNKDIIKPTIHSQRTNKLYEGVCRVTIHSVDLFRRILGWKMGVIDYFAAKKYLNVEMNPDFINGTVFREMSKWSLKHGPLA